MSIIDIFSQAIEISDPDERLAYTERACGDDASLHQQVQQMLEQYYDPKTFMAKAAIDAKQVLARFEAERQALAMMNHPNIAKIFDAGSTVTGRSYFVIELVQGLPITEYCNQYKLDLRERLALFTHVCNAIQRSIRLVFGTKKRLERSTPCPGKAGVLL